MLKLRITFTDTTSGHEELEHLLQLLNMQDNITILSESGSYANRGNNLYLRKYVDLEIER